MYSSAAGDEALPAANDPRASVLLVPVQEEREKREKTARFAFTGGYHGDSREQAAGIPDDRKSAAEKPGAEAFLQSYPIEALSG